MGTKGCYRRIKQHQFLFEELVKRDFKKKYKRTVLGMAWSVLSPLLMLAVMAVIFGQFFGRSTPHYIIYLFSGQIVFHYYMESTNEGMDALLANAGIFSKINAPKYLFLLSKNVSALVNFFIVFLLYFVFVLAEGIPFTWKFLCLAYPVVCLAFINLGLGLALSALFIFFRDTRYLYRVFTQVVMYGSAIFYNIEIVPPEVRRWFYANPIFVAISYFRSIVLMDTVPGLWLHGLLAFYAAVLFGAGLYMYRKYNYQFLYYI